jgi:hypothetical protein
MRLSKTVAAGFLSLFMTAGLVGQSDTGAISGTITDPNGAVIPGAAVRAVNDSTGREVVTRTTEAGLYAFPNLTVGPYTITAEQAGFRKLQRSGVELRLAQRITLDLQLEVGELQQSVDVTAEAPLLNPATSEVGSNFSPKFMRDLPLFTGGIRNPEVFVTYMPGVNNGSGDSSINGGSRRAKEVLIDGASLTIPESGGVVFYFPAAEQFGEFKLLTNSFSAEYGRTGGGIEIFLTRSGTNDLHGTGYYNLRRDVLDSNGWLRNLTTNQKAKVRINEVGVGAGGPVWIPKLYNGRNKTFWFFTWVSDQRPTTVSNAINNIPSSRMRTGDFSELPLPLFDPNTTAGSGSAATRQPFPGNIIPQNRFSSVSQKILPLVPEPTLGGIANNYITTNTSKLDRHQVSAKGDHAITDKHRASFWISDERWYNVNETNFTGPLSHALKNDYIKSDYTRLNYDWIIKPNLILHVTHGWSITRTGWSNDDQQGWASRLGITGVQYDAFPSIFFRGDDNYLGFANTNGNKTVGTQFNSTQHVTAGVSWVKGRHEYKFGGDFRRTKTFGPVIDQAGAQGQWEFARAQTADPLRTATTGNAFASFLLGLPTRAAVNLSLPEFNDSARYGYQGFYVQDNWKVSSKLTLNLGLRYDVPLARYSPLGVFTSFDPELPNPKVDNRPGALTYAGFGPGRINAKRFADIDWSEFGPRIGFAYQLDPKTVIRGAWGIYYAAGNHTTGGFCLGCSFGFTASPERISADGYSPALNWDGGFQPGPGFVPPPFIDPSFANGQSPWYINPRSGIQPRIKNWNFTVQRELPKGVVLNAAYVGHRGSNLNSTVQLNQLDPKYLSLGALLNRNINDPAVAAAGFTKPYSSFTGTLAQALRPYPQFLDVPDHYGALGKSWYDALQTTVEKRFGYLQAFVGYTWSKSLSDGSYTQTAFQEENQDSYNRGRAEKGLLRYDIPHMFNVLWTLDMPFGPGRKWITTRNPLISRVVGGWTVSWAGQYRSGNLLLLAAPNTLDSGVLFTKFKKATAVSDSFETGLARSDYDPRDPARNLVYDRSAFVVPGQFEFGATSRYLDDFRNPGVSNENIAIIKRTKFRQSERIPLEFEYSAYLFNPFNRTQFGNIQASLTAPNFGRITGPMVGPRIITMGLRLNW